MNIKEHRFGTIPCLGVDTWWAAGVFHGFLGAELDVLQGVTPFEEAFSYVVHPSPKLLLLQQEHGQKIISLLGPEGPEQANKLYTGAPPVGDAWIINVAEPGLEGFVVAIKTADCFPILIRGRKGTLMAAVHCGWRGSVQGLLVKIIMELQLLGESVADLELAVGPGIRSCCFEIDSDVADEISQSYNQAVFHEKDLFTEKAGFPVKTVGQHLFGNLETLLVAQALHAGVASEQIVCSKQCSCCSQKFFSVRRQGEKAGREASFVGVGRLSKFFH